MIRSTRRTVIRLVVLALLLLAFPVFALLLRSMSVPPPPAVAIDLSGRFERLPSDEPDRPYSLTLELASRAETTWQVEQVFLTLLEGEEPVLTLIEDRRAIEGRMGGTVRLGPGRRVELGPITLALAPGTRGELLLASVRFRETESDEAVTIQAELPWPEP